MDSIQGIRSIGSVDGSAPSGRPRTGADREPAGLPAAPARATSSAAPVVGQRPLPTFLTQLIATADDAPQTRRHRRAAVGDALAAYAAAALLTGGAASHSCSAAA